MKKEKSVSRVRLRSCERTGMKSYKIGVYKVTKKNQNIRRGMYILTVLYGAACLWLYYHQSIADLQVSGSIPYQSDLPLHISMIVEDGWYYSFTAYAYKALYDLLGGSTAGIAVLLAVLSVGSIYVTEGLVCLFGGYQEKNGLTLAAAISVNMVMPIYLDAAGIYRYVSFQSPNVWHNSTYICMKFFALLTLWYYFKLEEKYREGLSVKEWVIFAILNIITTGIKPSFLLAFSPIMGIFLLADLCKRVPFKRIFLFGSALLPSGLVILWQNAVLFGQDTGNGMAFEPWYTFSLHADRPKLAVICSVAFCAVTVLVTIKDICKEKRSLFVVLMAVLGFLEALCLTESGSRAVDGNFLWGNSFTLFVLFAFSAVKCFQYPKKTGITGRSTGSGHGVSSLLKKTVYIGMVLLFAWHLLCGTEFFIRLVCGETYWMTW